MSASSQVRASGSIIRLPEIAGLLAGCESLYQTLKGKAELRCIEPNLYIALSAHTGGHIEVKVSLSPEPLSEQHEFKDSIDQTFLPGIIGACKKILASFPMRQDQVQRDDAP